MEQPLRMALGRWDTWGAFYGEARVAPLVRDARDAGLYDGQAGDGWPERIGLHQLHYA